MGYCICHEPCFALHDTIPTCSLISSEIYHSLHQRHHIFWSFLWIVDWTKFFWLQWCRLQGVGGWAKIYMSIYFHDQQHSYYSVHKETNMYCIIFYKIGISCISWSNQKIWIKHLSRAWNFENSTIWSLLGQSKFIKISHNHVYHTKTKHFEIHVHFVKNMVERKEIRISYVSIDNQSIYILMKALKKTKFENCVKLFNTSAISKS